MVCLVSTTMAATPTPRADAQQVGTVALVLSVVPTLPRTRPVPGTPCLILPPVGVTTVARFPHHFVAQLTVPAKAEA